MSSAKSEIQKRYLKEFKGMYDQLEKLKNENEEGVFDNADGVFRTYIGEKYRKSSERLMIVGKATTGWDDKKDDAKKFVMECVTRGFYTSSFWRFIYKLLLQIHHQNSDSKKPDREDRESREELFEQVVWSNIMKIGINSGNPTRLARRYQRKDCIRLIKREIGYLKPTKLVFVVGKDYREEVFETLGIGFNKEFDLDNGICRLEPSPPIKNCTVFWTRHPQGWAKDDMREAIRKIASQ